MQDYRSLMDSLLFISTGGFEIGSIIGLLLSLRASRASSRWLLAFGKTSVSVPRSYHRLQLSCSLHNPFLATDIFPTSYFTMGSGLVSCRLPFGILSPHDITSRVHGISVFDCLFESVCSTKEHWFFFVPLQYFLTFPDRRRQRWKCSTLSGHVGGDVADNILLNCVRT